MKIEQAIKQKMPFKSEWHKAAVNLMFSANWLSEQLSEQLKPYSITVQQYNVLRILRGACQPMSTSAIRERMLDKMSDTSRMVDRLEQKGLVVRRVCQQDKRLVDVFISEQGIQVLAQIDIITMDFDSPLISLTEQEAVQLNELLDKMRSADDPSPCCSEDKMI